MEISSKAEMAGQILEFLHEIGKLKTLDRQGWVIRSIPKPETVAGHMHRMAIMAMFALDRSLTKDLNMDKVIKMCLVHDMAECIVGEEPNSFALHCVMLKDFKQVFYLFHVIL